MGVGKKAALLLGQFALSKDTRCRGRLITRIRRASWFNQQDVDFSPCHGPMLNPFGQDKNLARTECDRAIPQLDVECSFEDKKKIVCLVMFVPVERSFKLRYHRGTNWHSRHEGRRC